MTLRYLDRIKADSANSDIKKKYKKGKLASLHYALSGMEMLCPFDLSRSKKINTQDFKLEVIRRHIFM